jgi:hypothetical protein
MIAEHDLQVRLVAEDIRQILLTMTDAFRRIVNSMSVRNSSMTVFTARS